MSCNRAVVQSAPPLVRCRDCGLIHASSWIRCPSCESIFQQEQKLYRVGP